MKITKYANTIYFTADENRVNTPPMFQRFAFLLISNFFKLLSAMFNFIAIALVDTGCKLNVHKRFRRRPGRLLNVSYTFNLCPVSTGAFILFSWLRNESEVVQATFLWSSSIIFLFPFGAFYWTKVKYRFTDSSKWWHYSSCVFITFCNHICEYL